MHTSGSGTEIQKLVPRLDLRDRGCHHILDGETEVPLYILNRSRGAKSFHPDHRTAGTDVPIPPLGHRLLHRHPRHAGGWKDAVAVAPLLAFEQLP
jgi:hypothetical protein